MASENRVQVPRIKLGKQGFEVSAQGLGCMSMSFLYGPAKAEADMIELIRYAIGRGVTHLDTSDVYGPHTNELLLGKALKGVPRHKVEVSTKFGCFLSDPEKGMEGGMGIRGDPAYVRACCEASLKRLELDYIDLYYQHRIDSNVPIEITMGELKKLVEEGKIKYVGLSEASASTIRRAHAVHPLTAIQLEWSLMSRDAEEEIIPTCRELGIGVVAYSPTGRGFFSTGPKVVESFTQDDYRKKIPRFQEENLDHNIKLYNQVKAVASRKGCTPGQVALAWVHHQGQGYNNDVCPIPGTTKIDNLNQNIGALSVKLGEEDMDELNKLEFKGGRYQSEYRTWKDSETPPLSTWKGH